MVLSHTKLQMMWLFVPDYFVFRSNLLINFNFALASHYRRMAAVVIKACAFLFLPTAISVVSSYGHAAFFLH
jgi:hypothetical protein